MKKTMRFLSVVALAFVGAVMTGCSNDDDSAIDKSQQLENTSKKVVTMRRRRNNACTDWRRR